MTMNYAFDVANTFPTAPCSPLFLGHMFGIFGIAGIYVRIYRLWFSYFLARERTLSADGQFRTMLSKADLLSVSKNTAESSLLGSGEATDPKTISASKAKVDERGDSRLGNNSSRKNLVPDRRSLTDTGPSTVSSTPSCKGTYVNSEVIHDLKLCTSPHRDSSADEHLSEVHSSWFVRHQFTIDNRFLTKLLFISAAVYSLIMVTLFFGLRELDSDFVLISVTYSCLSAQVAAVLFMIPICTHQFLCFE